MSAFLAEHTAKIRIIYNKKKLNEKNPRALSQRPRISNAQQQNKSMRNDTYVFSFRPTSSSRARINRVKLRPCRRKMVVAVSVVSVISVISVI